MPRSARLRAPCAVWYLPACASTSDGTRVTAAAADLGRGVRSRGGPWLRRRRAGIAALIAAAVLTELAVAAALTQPQLGRLLALLLGTAALALVFAFPLAATVVLLALTASVLPTISRTVGPIEIRLQELLLLALLLVAVVAPRSQRWGGVPGAALAVFLGLVALSGWLAVQSGRVALDDALSFARPLAFYASFWVVLRLIPDARSLRRLLMGALACGAVAGLLAIPVTLGSPVGPALQGDAQNVITPTGPNGLGGLLRVRFPGVALSYVLFWWSVLALMTTRGRSRPVLAVLVAASAIGILLSFNRNMWLGLMFGTALVLVLAGLQVRRRLLAGMAIGIAAVVLTFTVASQSSQPQLDPVLARAATLLDPQQVVQENSLLDRAAETAAAWRTFEQHPLGGVGPGADFGVRANLQVTNGVYVTGVQRFVHNQWLWLLLVGGIPALLAFATFLVSVLARAWSLRLGTLSQRALGVGLAMTMLSSFVMISLSVDEFCLALGVVAAVVVQAHELERRRRGRPEPAHAPAR